MAKNIGDTLGVFVSKDGRIRSERGGNTIGKMRRAGGYWYAKIGDHREAIGWKKRHALENGLMRAGLR